MNSKATEPARQSEIAVEHIDATQIGLMWSSIYQAVAASCGMTLWPCDVYAAISKGKALAWVVIEDGELVACAVTQGREKGGAKWLEVVTLGRMPDAPADGFARWGAALQARLELYMRDRGHEAMRAHCRRGLKEWLAPMGWRERQIVMEWRDDG